MEKSGKFELKETGSESLTYTYLQRGWVQDVGLTHVENGALKCDV
jgi:hypothetical protein